MTRLLCTALALLLAPTLALRHGPLRVRSPAVAARPRLAVMQSTEDEIAALEAKLKEAKERQVAEAEVKLLEDQIELKTVERAEGFDASTLSMRKKVATEQGDVLEELLSEAWKEQGDIAKDECGLPFGAIGGALALAGLIAFSQVPVGKDTVSEVTYGGKVTPVETAAQIRARYAGVEEDEAE